jgi:cobalt-zinc-cadmium efflux system membrane fusion protein
VKNSATFALLVLTVSCRNAEPPAPGGPSDRKTFSVTHWTDRTELFMEFPPLVAGQKGRFAVHLTDLRTFKAVAGGAVDVTFRRSEAAPVSFAISESTRPGIFGVDVTVSEPGAYTLTVSLRSAAVQDVHELGTLTVYRTDAEAASAPATNPAEETITFLKEQQWTLDFATELAALRTVRESVTVPATIEARTGGVAEVTVPFAARLVRRGALPAVGTMVAEGQVLGGLVPPTSNPADLPALELARAEAHAALELARKERSRVERLLVEGAIPLRRLEESSAVEATAAARLKAAEARIAQYEATRVAATEAATASTFLLRAPISGVVAETHATSGANVEAGENLFKIIDVERPNLVGHVPERDAARLAGAISAEFEVPGAARPRSVGRLVSIGRIVDPQTRTFAIIYEVDNRNRVLALGQSGSLRLFTSTGAPRTAIRDSAIVDDAGRPVAFVQIAGESFARRPVTLGSREGGYVEVLEGVRPGQRVVVRGAHLVRLAALSTQVPAHGHVH